MPTFVKTTQRETQRVISLVTDVLNIFLQISHSKIYKKCEDVKQQKISRFDFKNAQENRTLLIFLLKNVMSSQHSYTIKKYKRSLSLSLLTEYLALVGLNFLIQVFIFQSIYYLRTCSCYVKCNKTCGTDNFSITFLIDELRISRRGTDIEKPLLIYHRSTMKIQEELIITIGRWSTILVSIKLRVNIKNWLLIFFKLRRSILMNI